MTTFIVMTYERAFHTGKPQVSAGLISFAMASADIIDYTRTIVDSYNPGNNKPDFFIDVSLGFSHAVRPFLTEAVSRIGQHPDIFLHSMTQFLVVAQYDPTTDRIVNKQIIPFRDLSVVALNEGSFEDEVSRVSLKFIDRLNDDEKVIVKDLGQNEHLTHRLLVKARRWSVTYNQRLSPLVQHHFKMVGIRQAPFSANSLDTEIPVDRFNAENIGHIEKFFNRHVTSVEYGRGDSRRVKLFFQNPLTSEMATGIMELLKCSEFDVLHYQTNTLGNGVVDAEVLNLDSGSFGVWEMDDQVRSFIGFNSCRYAKSEGAMRFAEQVHARS